MTTYFHYSPDGAGIVTNATDDRQFLDECADSLCSILLEQEDIGGKYDKLRSLHGKSNDERLTMIRSWIEQVVDICCRHRGYKAPNVQERILLKTGPISFAEATVVAFSGKDVVL